MSLRHSKALKLLAVLLVLAMAATAIPIGARAAADVTGTYTFTDSGISGSGDGAEIDGTTLTITGAGTYVITGSCSEGSVVVKKGTTGVTLILQDLTLSSSTTAPLVCKKQTEVTLDIEGTVTLTDREDPANEDSTDADIADAFEGAAIKAKDGATLVIGGSGTLNINGESCKNGIKGGATTAITIQSGTVNVKAAKNGIASDGTLTITGGTVSVEAGNDGIKADPDSDDTESKGTLTITGGTVNVSAGDDGLKAGYDLILGTSGSATGPTIFITKSNEGIEGANIVFHSGTGTIHASDDGINAANSDLSGYSFLFTVNGGTWTVYADGDGIDSNGDIVNNGGSVLVYGSSNDGNAAMDVGDNGGSWSSNGGSVLAIGMSGMAIVPGSGTYVAFGTTGMGGPMGGGNMGGMPGGAMGGRGGTMQTMAAEETLTTQAAGTGSISIQNGSSIVIRDSSGNTVAEATGVKSANSVVYTGENLKSGETYTLYVNGTAAATATATAGSGSSNPGSSGGQSGGSTPPAGSGTTPPAENGNTYPANTTPFTDVGSNQWYSEAVNTVYARGIMAGTDAASFSPSMELTRGMLIQMLYAMEGKPSVSSKTTFTDVSASAYYYDAVSWAQANGIAAGYGDGTLGPNDKLTREQAVQILYAYAKYKGVSISGSKDTASFSDAASIHSYASAAMKWAYGNTLIAGFEDGTLRPSGTTTRAQMAQIMMRYLQLLER